tara:strand:- start:148 stop:393 length:246 start_codon:yes stop_codon:yes gene_type:complete
MSIPKHILDRAKRMAELEELFPNTLRCMEGLQQHAPTLKYVWDIHRPTCLRAYTLSAIAKGENVCPDTLLAIYKADFAFLP